MGRPVAYKGRLFVIVYATDSTGSHPGEDFFNGLSEMNQSKLLTLFRYLGDRGTITNREKFRKLLGDLWEFKSHQIRMICTFKKNRTVVLTHGFVKKRQDTSG